MSNFKGNYPTIDDVKIDKNTIIIAHSIGLIFICKYLIIFFENLLSNATHKLVNQELFIDYK